MAETYAPDTTNAALPPLFENVHVEAMADAMARSRDTCNTSTYNGDLGFALADWGTWLRGIRR